MTEPTPENWVQLLKREAPALRAAGVLLIEIGPFKAALAPAQTVAPRPVEEKPQNDKDTMADPFSYAQDPDEPVPGFRRRERK